MQVSNKTKHFPHSCICWELQHWCYRRGFIPGRLGRDLWQLRHSGTSYSHRGEGGASCDIARTPVACGGSICTSEENVWFCCLLASISKSAFKFRLFPWFLPFFAVFSVSRNPETWISPFCNTNDQMYYKVVGFCLTAPLTIL